MGRRYESVLGTIGRTPVVRLNRLAPAHVDLYVKVEAFNPLGSIKDRLALGVIEDAEQTGKLTPGQTVVEATSGNTGIGLAMVCAAKGYPLVVTMAENFSIERRKIMRFLGARVVLTPASLRGTGMLAKAAELAEEHGWFLARQFENEANADIHSRTTAREILDDFEGERLDYWVTGFGTGGTLKGVARVLARERPETKVLVCEPDNSPVLASGTVQERHPDGSPSVTHPAFRTHLIQGWSPDFVPKLAEDAVALELVDGIVPVNSGDAVALSKELAEKEGLFVGISAGATLAGALRVAKTAPAGATILCMLPDTAERYLSTTLFEDVPEEMTDEEIGISHSTPNYRFDDTTAAAADAAPQPTITEWAQAFVDEAVSDPAQPVVMFALEWCEFCWSLRKLFQQCGIAYRSVDLDSVEHQQENRGEQIRAALQSRTGSGTLPQVFVGGRYLGGCTEVLEAHTEGGLHRALAACGVEYDSDAVSDVRALLPSWLHPR